MATKKPMPFEKSGRDMKADKSKTKGKEGSKREEAMDSKMMAGHKGKGRKAC